MPKGILVGIICHYTIMPLIGFALANLFHFPGEIAAGIILVGCCPSGLASNVMSYLSRAQPCLVRVRYHHLHVARPAVDAPAHETVGR